MCACFNKSQGVNRIAFPIFYAAYKRQFAKIAIYERPFETFHRALFTSFCYIAFSRIREALKEDKNAINVSAITDTSPCIKKYVEYAR